MILAPEDDSQRPPSVAEAAQVNMAAAFNTDVDNANMMSKALSSAGLPNGLLSDSADVAALGGGAPDMAALAQEFPQTAALLAEIDGAQMLQNDVDALSTLERTGRNFVGGVLRLPQMVRASELEYLATRKADIEDLISGAVTPDEVETRRGRFSADAQLFREKGAEGLQAYKSQIDERYYTAFDEYSAYENLISFAQRPTSEMQAFQRSRGQGPNAAFEALTPGIALDIFAQSAPFSAPIALGAVLGAPISASAAVVFGGAASAGVNYEVDRSSALSQITTEARDKDAMARRIASAPELRGQQDFDRAVKSIVIGAVDALTMGAGHYVAGIGGSMAIDALGGAAGEALGSLAIGETPYAADVILEGVAEIPAAVVTTPIVVAAKRAENADNERRMREGAEIRSRIFGRLAQGFSKVADAESRGAVLDEFTTVTADLASRGRDPLTVAKFVDSLKNSGAPETIYIDPNALQQANIDLGQLAQVSPSFAAQVGEAIATQGTVAVPFAEYATMVAPSFADQLNDHVRFDPDGFSRAEAKVFMQEQAEQVKAEVASLVNDAQIAEPYEQARTRVEETIFRQLESANRFTNPVNRAYAAMVANTYAVMGARGGMSAEELFQQFPLRVQATAVGDAAVFNQPEFRGVPLNEDGTVTLTHFSGTPGLTALDPAMWGATGAALTRSERNRIGIAPGRSYLYLGAQAKPEAQLGAVRYEARVRPEELYDIHTDPAALRAPALAAAEAEGTDRVAAIEKAILDAGFKGYITAAANGETAVVFFQPIEVKETANVSTQTTLGGLLDRYGVPRSAGLLDDPSGQKYRPLEGAPESVKVAGRGDVAVAPFAPARDAAYAYMAAKRLNYTPPTQMAEVDVERARRIADAFEAMEHTPNDPVVEQAYREMIDQTLEQYQFIKATGLRVDFIEAGMPDPYAASPRLAILDVTENNHLWVFPTDDGFGGASSLDVNITGNPLLAYTNEYVNGRQLRANDVFRIVHDYFGHVKDGNGFRAVGEENAWQSHAAMYTPLARRAMTTETRGQNSWVNFGPYAEKNRTANAAETEYAPQKIGLLPEWVSSEGFLGGVDSGRPVGEGLFMQQDAALYDVGAQDAAKKTLGVTELVGDVGYILPDGTLLDLQRSLEGGIEHFAAAEKVLRRANISYRSEEDAQATFERLTGAVRVDFNDGIISSSRPLPAAVARKIGRAVQIQYADTVPPDFEVDVAGAFETLRGEEITSKSFLKFARPGGGGVYNQLDATGTYENFANGGFFSKMYRVLDAKLNATGTVEQYRKQIEAFIKNGEFKAEEYEWSGLGEALTAIDETIQRRLMNNKVYGFVNAEGVFEAPSTAPREGYVERTIDVSPRIEKAKVMDALRSTGRKSYVVIREETTDQSDTRPTTDDIRVMSYRQEDPSDSNIEYFEDDLREQIAAEPEAYSWLVNQETGEIDEGALQEEAYARALNTAGETADVRVGDELYEVQVERDAGGWRLMSPEGEEIASGGASSRNFYEQVESEIIDALIEQELVRNGDGDGVRFEEYTEGGPQTQYTELVIHLPDIRDKGVNQHFEDYNTLMHIRFNRRSGANGESVMFVEEIQSDWHQQGRQKGYMESQEAIDAYAQRRADARTAFRKAKQDLRDFYAEKLGSATPMEKVDQIVQLQARNPDFILERFELPAEAKPLVVQLVESENILDRVLDEKAPGDIADAPFKTSWPELAMKRVMLWAAESGYDQVAWTTGEMQAQRYSSALQAQVEDITVDSRMNVDGLIAVSVTSSRGARGNVNEFVARQVGAQRNEVGYSLLTPEQISTVFGKSVAEQIVEAVERSAADQAPVVIEGADLTISDKGMVGFYDKMLPSLTNKLLKRFKQEVRPLNIMLSEKTAVLGFDVTQDMKNELMKSTGGFPLFQNSSSRQPRGTYDPSSQTLSLLNAANLSTFLHESGHHFLEMMQFMSAQPDAPADIKADFEAALKWMEIPESADGRAAVWNTMDLEQRRAGHEKFARGFEAYLFEGKAPNMQLGDIFRRFKAWLVRTYKQITSLNAELDPEIRGVFDRMVATTTQIQEAEHLRAYEALFDSAEAGGMTPDAFRAYEVLGMAATQEAIEDLQSRSLRDMRWLANAKSRELKRLQKQAAAKRREVREEVANELKTQPVYQVLDFLRTGNMNVPEDAPKEVRRAAAEVGQLRHKLSIPALKEQYGEEGNALWRFLQNGRYGLVTAEDGIAPDMVASMFGFDSGDAMIRAILEAPDFRQTVEEQTDQRMLEEYGDLVDSRAMERAAERAIHNEARAKFIATEVNALLQAAGKPRLMAEAAKEYANGAIGALLVRDVRPSRYANAEGKAGRESLEAFRRGDTETAAIKKRAQLLQNYSAKAAVEALNDVSKALRYFKKFNKKSTAKNISPEYMDQIQQLLSKYELSTVSLKALDKRKKLADFVESQRELGIEPNIPQELIDQTEIKNYKEATVDELRGLYDTIKQIEHLGRMKDKLLTAKDKREFNATIESIVANMRAKGPQRTLDERRSASNWEATKMGFKGYLAMHRKLASIGRQFDGFEDGGLFWDTFIRPMNAAGAREATMRQETTAQLLSIIQPLLSSRPFADAFGSKKEFFPTINMSLNREERMAMALNVGNSSNLQRLLDGEGWTREQLQPVLDTLTAEEWQAVQSIWDLFESFRPMIAAKEKRIYGVEPKWIEATPVITPFGELRGGYYPVKFDALRSDKAAANDEAEEAKRMMKAAYTSATTRRSFTKERADKVVGMPLLYTLDGLYSGLNDVIHDLTWHEWVIDMNRTLRDGRVSSAVRDMYGNAILNQVKTALRDIAGGDVMPADAFGKILGNLRAGATVAGLGFNLVNSVINTTGLTQSVSRIGARWVGLGLREMARRPRGLMEEVHARSEMMRNRMQTRLREVNEIQSMIRGKSSIRQKVDALMFAPMYLTQIGVDTPTWWGAYQKALLDTGNEETAAALADQAVLDSQSGGMVKDLSAIQRGPEYAKLFTTFYGYFNATYNLAVEKTRKADLSTPGGVVKLAGDYLLLAVVPAVLTTVLKTLFTGDDEDWELDKLAEKTAAESLGFMTGTLVGVREFSGAVQALAGVQQYNTGYGGPAGLRFIQEVYKLAQQISQEEADAPLMKAFVNVLGIIFKLPSAQINRTLTGAAALYEGETENPAALIGGPPNK